MNDDSLPQVVTDGDVLRKVIEHELQEKEQTPVTNENPWSRLSCVFSIYQQGHNQQPVEQSHRFNVQLRTDGELQPFSRFNAFKQTDAWEVINTYWVEEPSGLFLVNLSKTEKIELLITTDPRPLTAPQFVIRPGECLPYLPLAPEFLRAGGRIWWRAKTGTRYQITAFTSAKE